MKKEIKDVIVIAVGAISVASLCVSAKVADDVKKLNKSIDDAADKIDVEIPEKIVAEAVDRAANNVAKTEASRVSSNANAIISNSVKKEINAVKEHISDDVNKEIKRQIDLVDVSDIKNDVTKEVGSMVFNDMMANKTPSIELKNIL